MRRQTRKDLETGEDDLNIKNSDEESWSSHNLSASTYKSIEGAEDL